MDTVLEFEKNRPHGGMGELSSFVGIPSKAATKELPSSVEELFRGIVSVLNSLLLRAIEKQTKQEFVDARAEVFGDVRKTTRALGNLARVIVPKRTLERVAWESFSEMEADFTQEGLKRFGETARDQAIFTVWTFKRIVRLLNKIAEGGCPPKGTETRDREIAKEFSFYIDWSQFHLECLVVSMRSNKPIHPEVLEVICEGMRGAVNAYGLVRQGIELRWPSKEDESPSSYEWSKEDEELLDLSMADMAEMDFLEY